MRSNWLTTVLRRGVSDTQSTPRKRGQESLSAPRQSLPGYVIEYSGGETLSHQFSNWVVAPFERFVKRSGLNSPKKYEMEFEYCEWLRVDSIILTVLSSTRNLCVNRHQVSA